MKSLHPARRRLLIGGLLLATTFFYAFASTCGLLGMLISRGSALLIGQTGSTLVAMMLLGSALAFLIPHGGVRQFVTWVAHGREARVAKVVREMDKFERDRRGVVEVEVEHEMVTPVKVPPATRIKLDTVREALRSLGYKRDEYMPLVEKMDPKMDFEILVKGALKELRAETN